MNRLFAAFIKTSTHSTSVLFLLLLFSITSASGQPGTEKGLPFITNYTAKMYHGNVQNWSIEQDKNGIIIPAKRIEAIKDAMHYMISESIQFEEMKNNSRKMIVDRFEQILVWNALLAEYNSLVENV